MGPEFTLMNIVDLVNQNNETKKVFVNYEIEYLEGHIGTDAAATVLSVTGCGASGNSAKIKLDPNGVAVTESPKMFIGKDAKIIGARKSLNSTQLN